MYILMYTLHTYKSVDINLCLRIKPISAFQRDKFTVTFKRNIRSINFVLSYLPCYMYKLNVVCNKNGK